MAEMKLPPVEPKKVNHYTIKSQESQKFEMTDKNSEIKFKLEVGNMKPAEVYKLLQQEVQKKPNFYLPSEKVDNLKEFLKFNDLDRDENIPANKVITFPYKPGAAFIQMKQMIEIKTQIKKRN